MKILNYLFLLLLFITSARSANLENCTTPINEAGQCVQVKFCSIFNKYLQSTNIKLTEQFYNYLNRSICGFIKFESYVCCAARHIIEDVEISSEVNKPTISSSTDKPYILPPPSLNQDESSNNRYDSSNETHKNANLLDTKRCGIVNSEKISNGNKTELNEFPWMALLQYETISGLEFKCGGSLISKRYVLTAAHCVKTASKLVSVRLGEHNINDVTDCDEITGYCAPPVQDIDVEEIIPHFKYWKGSFKYDIALIRLKSEANIAEENIKPICLPLSNEFQTIEETTAIVSGWGYTEKSNKISNELFKAEVPVQPISVCQNFYKSKIPVTNSELCAGGQNYVDTCYGDSGGPLFAPATSLNQKIPLFYQMGIVSAGYTKCGEMNTYTIFTNVTFYINWILDNLKP